MASGLVSIANLSRPLANYLFLRRYAHEGTEITGQDQHGGTEARRHEISGSTVTSTPGGTRSGVGAGRSAGWRRTSEQRIRKRLGLRIACAFVFTRPPCARSAPDTVACLRASALKLVPYLRRLRVLPT